MSFKVSLSALLIAGPLLLPMSNTPAKQEDRVPLGVWGGMHIRLSVNNDGADVEYDCAHGTIAGALKVGADGSFSATGTLVQERGGPVRLGEPRDSKPVRYSGRLTGKSMTLTVKHAGSSEDYGTYTLTHGSQGRLRKCK